MPIRIALGVLFLFALADPFKWLEPTITPSNKQVTMYSTSWCGYCRKARQVFTQQNIPFRELDIEKMLRRRKLMMLSMVVVYR
jgi:thiol-disulfide isomerase/thioredoxin